jgi:Homeodomain-like domain-containing protein
VLKRRLPRLPKLKSGEIYTGGLGFVRVEGNRGCDWDFMGFAWVFIWRFFMSERVTVTSGNLADEVKLESAQEAVMELVRVGKTIAEAARVTGVARSTVYRWLKSDWPFMTVFNQWRDETEASCRSKLTSLTDKAAEAVEKALEAGDARTAMQLLKGMGMIRPQKELATEPEEVRRRIALQQKRRRVKLEKAERGVELNERSSKMLDGEVEEMIRGWK